MALLTATDEVEYCTQTTEASYAQRLGSGFLPTDLIRLSCQCGSDLRKHTFAELFPDQPALQNAILQSAMNNGDLLEIVSNDSRYPGGAQAFTDFLEQDAPGKLGFDAQQLLSATALAAEFTATHTEELKAIVLELPSCEAMAKATVTQFPQFGDKYSPELWDEFISAREAEFSQTVTVPSEPQSAK